MLVKTHKDQHQSTDYYLSPFKMGGGGGKKKEAADGPEQYNTIVRNQIMHVGRLSSASNYRSNE